MADCLPNTYYHIVNCEYMCVIVPVLQEYKGLKCFIIQHNKNLFKNLIA